jgi:hypothetical protein
MRKIFVILILFSCLKSEAQKRVFGPAFTNINSNRWGWFGTGGTDTVGYVDSLRVKFFKPVLPGSYTTATAPPASAFPGYIIYNTDSLKPQYSNGTNWLNLPGAGGGGGGGSYIFNSPLSESGGSVSIANAAADGSTKGAASFTANDFDASSGNISIDYTNAQMATGSLNGFMSATTQTLGGAKTWSGNAVFNGTAQFNGTTQIGGTANAVLNLASSANSVRGSIDLSSNNPTLNTATGTWLFRSAGSTIGIYNGTGFFIGGGTTPSGFIFSTLAGTSTLATYRMNHGVDLTTAVEGSFEFATVSSVKRLAFTANGTNRRRILLSNDVAPGNGQIPIGNGTDYTVANLASADGTVTITNGSGTIDLKTTLFMSQGTYTPTFTAVANADGAAVTGSLYYTRIGNQVTVRGVITVDATATGLLTTVGITLPIASALTATQQLSGQCTSSAIGAAFGTILADATNDRAELSFINDTNVGSATYSIWFSYEVL